MKFKVPRPVTGSIIFLFIIAAVFAFLQPLYRVMNRILSEFGDEYLALLAEKTGLAVSYESLSPSILTGISIKGIVVSDAENGEEILTVDNAVAGYNLKKLLDKDFQNAFTGIKIYNVNFVYDSQKLVNVEKKFRQLFPPHDDGDNFFIKLKNREVIKNILFALPFDVEMKNIKFEFNRKDFFLEACILESTISKNRRTSALSGNIDGFAKFGTSLLNRKTFGFNFSAKGNLLRSMDGSLFNINLSELRSADFSLLPFSVLALFDGSSFIMRSRELALPVNLFASLDADSGIVDVNLETEKLNPFDIVRFPRNEKIFEKMRGSRVTTESTLSVDIRKAAVEWTSNSDVFVSRSLIPDGEVISFSANGNNKALNVSSLRARGELLAADFSGSYDIKEKKPEGFLSAEHFTLPNGNRISGEVSVKSGKSGISVEVPSLALGEKQFSKIRAAVIPSESSFDFTFFMNGFLHEDSERPSLIRGDGSLAFGSDSYLECSVQVSDLFLDNIASAVSHCIDTEEKKTIAPLVETLSPFIMSTEMYFSTDFSNLTYNIPYSILANTEADRQFLILSVDGSRNSINVTQADLIYGKNSVMAVFSADVSPEDNQVIFTSDFTINSIPYSVSGVYSSGEWLNVTGSYDFNLVANFNYGVSGSLQFSSLPLSVEGILLGFTTETTFAYNSADDFNVDFRNFEAEEIAGKFILHPKVSLSANLNSRGIVFSTLLYADSFSTLEGNGYALWNINYGIFDSMNAHLDLKNPVSQEVIAFSGNITNPLGEKFSLDSLKRECFFSAEADINSFPLRRFMQTQPGDETFSALVNASGTFENPYIAVSLSGFSMQIAGSPLLLKGNLAVMEDKISIPDFDLRWQTIHVSDIHSEIDMKSFEGSAGAAFYAGIGNRNIKAPLSLSIENLSPEESFVFLPDSFSVEFNSEEVTGSLVTNPFPFSIMLVRSPGRWDIITNEYLGAYGEYLDDGTVYLNIQDDKPLHFAVNGTADMKTMNIDISDIYADLGSLAYVFNSEVLSVYSGILSGNLTVSGLVTDPNLDGEAFIRSLDFNLPSYIPSHLKSDEVVVEFTQDEIEIQDTPFIIDGASLTANAYASLDRWKPASFEFNVYTEKNNYIPIDVKIPRFRLKGRTSVQANMLWENGVIDLSGNVTLRESDINLITNAGGIFVKKDESQEENPLENLDMRISMMLNIGPKVHFALEPLVRGLIAPDTPVEFSMDTASGLWNVKGDVVLRGGEVSYLNRSFYIKEGRIILNETQDSINPNLTVRAETKEHDLNGDPVTITLSAIRQNAQDFDPVLSSIPAKSENEIMEILGNIAAGDSDNARGLLLAGVDYGVQVTVLRRLENALRDLCNFDIFSLRTTLLQNSLKQGFNMNTDNEKGSLISNLFDNSTVYIGKYFGSSIYVDALMHWTYDDSKTSSLDTTGGGLVFQPEIGLELESPFANIRWSFAPNLGELQQSWVQSTSITLSWRLNF